MVYEDKCPLGASIDPMGSHYDKFIRSLKGWKCAIDEDGKKNCSQLPNFDFIMGGVAGEGLSWVRR
jgi:hypothetical protein